MSRPNKTGLAYFNIDTDLFQNRKIRRLIKQFNGKGFLIYVYLLTEIYRDKGCFIVWDEDTAFDVSDSLNVSLGLVKEVIDYCCNVGLFDKELLASERILTSISIQERWEKTSLEAKRSIKKVEEINPNFCLFEKKLEYIQEETKLIPEKSELIQKSEEESTQSKVKKSKVNKPPIPPKGGEIDFERLTEFYNTTCTNLPNILSLTDERKKQIKLRAAEHGKEGLLLVIRKASASAFLGGQNDRGWRASFDFIFNKKQFVKILEDGYDKDLVKIKKQKEQVWLL